MLDYGERQKQAGYRLAELRLPSKVRGKHTVKQIGHEKQSLTRCLNHDFDSATKQDGNSRPFITIEPYRNFVLQHVEAIVLLKRLNRCRPKRLKDGKVLAVNLIHYTKTDAVKAVGDVMQAEKTVFRLSRISKQAFTLPLGQASIK